MAETGPENTTGRRLLALRTIFRSQVLTSFGTIGLTVFLYRKPQVSVVVKGISRGVTEHVKMLFGEMEGARGDINCGFSNNDTIYHMNVVHWDATKVTGMLDVSSDEGTNTYGASAPMRLSLSG